MRLLTSFLQKLISMNFFLLNTVKEGELGLPFVKVFVLGAEIMFVIELFMIMERLYSWSLRLEQGNFL